MRHNAQGFQQPVIFKSYIDEETEFKEKVSVIPRSVLHPNYNVFY